MTIAEIKRAPRNAEALSLLEAIINKVQENEDASNLNNGCKCNNRRCRNAL